MATTPDITSLWDQIKNERDPAKLRALNEQFYALADTYEASRAREATNPALAQPAAPAAPTPAALPPPDPTTNPMGFIDPASLGREGPLPSGAVAPRYETPRAPLPYDPNARPPQDPNAAPPADGPPAGMGSLIPAPQAEAFLSGRGGRGGGGGRGGVLGQAGRAASDAAGFADDRYDALQRRMEQQARDAETSGTNRAIEMAATEEEYAKQKAEFDAREQAAQGEYKRRIGAYEAAVKDFEAEAAKDKTSKLLGGGSVFAALAMAFGGFGASRSGTNVGLDVIKARVAHEADVRTRRLGAKRTKLDALDQLVYRTYQETQSVDAARKVAEGALLQQVQMKAERYATLSASTDKAEKLRLMNAQLDVARADADAQAKAAAYTSLQKSMRGPSRMQRLKEEAQALSNVEKAQKINAGGEEGGVEDKLYANQAKQLDELNKAEANLRELHTIAKKLKAEGKTEFPGREEFVRSPLEKTGRAVRSATGVDLPFGTAGRGPSGMTATEQYLASKGKVYGKAMHLAITGQSSNLQTEAADAFEDSVGNGDLQGFIDNMEMQVQAIVNQRDALQRSHDTPMRAAMRERHATTPAISPSGVAPRTFPEGGAAAPAAAFPPPRTIPGARRQGP